MYEIKGGVHIMVSVAMACLLLDTGFKNLRDEGLKFSTERSIYILFQRQTL